MIFLIQYWAFDTLFYFVPVLRYHQQLRPQIWSLHLEMWEWFSFCWMLKICLQYFYGRFVYTQILHDALVNVWTVKKCLIVCIWNEIYLRYLRKLSCQELEKKILSRYLQSLLISNNSQSCLNHVHDTLNQPFKRLWTHR